MKKIKKRSFTHSFFSKIYFLRFAWGLLLGAFSFFSPLASAFDLKLNSLRFTLSKPETNHSLIYRSKDTQIIPANNVGDKIHFGLSPSNNERFGVFADINGIEIGYAFDVIKDNQETKTQDFDFSYTRFRHSKISFNYQVLEGFQTEAENLKGAGENRQFLEKSESTKLELLGIHNFHTFFGESLFDHFFLNRPQLSNKTRFALSLVGGWSYKNLDLENPDSLLFQPDFLSIPVDNVSRVEAESIGFNVGPMLSVGLPNNIHLFAEFKYGRNHFNNLTRGESLKRSGEENLRAFGAGASWTSTDKKTLLVLRGWNQEARHIETLFGDLSLIRFFK